MTWVKLDDQFPIHRKVGALSDQAFRLHVEALCWCARHLTDGVVSTSDLPQVTRIAKSERYAAELVARGCWHGPGHDCDVCPPVEDGWVIHEYLGFQQSRSKVLHTREVRQAAGKLGGTRSGQSRRGERPPKKPQAKPRNEANAKQNQSKTQAAGVEPPAPFLFTKERPGRPPASPDGASVPADDAVPDWRSLPAAGEQREAEDSERLLRGVAAARNAMRKPTGDAA